MSELFIEKVFNFKYVYTKYTFYMNSDVKNFDIKFSIKFATSVRLACVIDPLATPCEKTKFSGVTNL